MIMNQTPYPISFEQQMSQALVCRYGEEMRQYIFKPDIDVSGLSCLLQIAKTDGTFTENGVEVHTDPDTGECTLVITIPQQATVVKGLNRYSICVYGPIEGEDHLLYSAEGPLWVDDNLITDDMIASVAEVNGLVFPQDFLTVENLVDIVNYVVAEIIKDDTTSETTTWSSQKISDEIAGHTPDIDVSKEASGNPIEFTDGADAPLVKCTTQIQGYQEGSGTPSPDNVRPIHAYTESTISVGGRNRLPLILSDLKLINTAGTWNDNVYTLNSMNFTVNADASNRIQSIRVHGNTLQGAGFYLARDFITDGSAVLSGCPSNGSTSTYYLEWVDNGDDVGNGAIIANPVSGNVRFRVVKVGTTYDFLIYPMIEIGSVAHEYEPYIKEDHTATFSNAIYQGNADFVGGEATAQKIKWTRNSSTMNNSESYPGWNDSGIADIIGHGKSGRITAIISVGSQFAVNTLGTNDTLFLPTDQYNLTQSQWIALAVDIDIVIELATPITETITPTNLPIKSLFGYNHIESSTGNMEIEYITQTYEPIAELINRSSLHEYSTEEHIIGKWIDGKTVYEKTIVNELALTSSWQQYFDASGIDTIVDVVMRTTRDNEEAPPAFSPYEIATWIKRSGYIQVSCNIAGWKILSMTVRYTKS